MSEDNQINSLHNSLDKDDNIKTGKYKESKK